MVKQKIIKIKVGEVYNKATKESESVFKTYWRKESKQGKVYYEAREVAFPGEVEIKGKQEQPEIIDM